MFSFEIGKSKKNLPKICLLSEIASENLLKCQHLAWKRSKKPDRKMMAKNRERYVTFGSS